MSDGLEKRPKKSHNRIPPQAHDDSAHHHVSRWTSHLGEERTKKMMLTWRNTKCCLARACSWTCSRASWKHQGWPSSLSYYWEKLWWPRKRARSRNKGREWTDRWSLCWYRKRSISASQEKARRWLVMWSEQVWLYVSLHYVPTNLLVGPMVLHIITMTARNSLRKPKTNMRSIGLVRRYIAYIRSCMMPVQV